MQDNATSPENAVTVTALSKPTGFTNELRYIQSDHLGGRSGITGRGAPSCPLLQDRGMMEGPGEHARPVDYVCDVPVPGRALVCQAPVTEPEGLPTFLEQR